MEAVADAAALATTAAERLIARVSEEDRPAVALTGGRSPLALYRLLASEPYRSRVPWSRVHWFWGDERFVPFDDPRNNASAAIDAMLSRVPVPAENIHRIPTTAVDAAEGARRYEQELRRFHGSPSLQGRPLFSLVLLGLGSDGHVASLFPGQPAIDEERRWVVPVAHAGLEPFVPRVTLTLPALASTREMLFLVSGADKRDALARVRSAEDLPACRARAQGELLWLADRAALES